MDSIKPGVYYDMPEKEYFAIPAIHNSLLSTLRDKSAKHAIHYATNDTPPTTAQKVGSQLHLALLERDRFHKEVIPYLPGDGRKKRVKDSKKFVKKAYPNASYYSKLSKVQQYLMQSEQARDNDIGRALFKEGDSEVVMIAEDPETGLPLKCRWDYINFDILVGMDYKTTRNAHPTDFMWSIYKYGYYRQVALYRYIASLLDIELRTQLILAQEKTAPYVAVWYDLEEWALEQGLNEVRDLINQFHTCLQTGEFPGYVNKDTGRNIIQIDLPEKAYTDTNTFSSYPN